MNELHKTPKALLLNAHYTVLLKCDLTTTRSEQERLQLERFELLSTANELRQQLRQVREGAAAKARSLEASPVYGNVDVAFVH